MTSSNRRWIWAGAAVLAIGLLASPKLLELRASADPPGPPPGSVSALVTVETVRPQPFRELHTTTGTLRADEEVRLSSEIAGRVVAVSFREGTSVSKGALLVKIFDQDLQAQRSRILSQKALAERELERQKELLAEGGTTRQLFDRAESELDVLDAELLEIDAHLIRTEIRAPFSGRIGLRAVSPGTYVSPGSPVATVSVLNPMKVEFSVPERLGPQIRIGAPVQFTVQGVADTFEGSIYASEPGVDEATRTIRYRARVQNPDRVLRPGAFARISVSVADIPDAILVPTVSVVPNGARQVVYVRRDGQAEPRVVQTGARTSERVQILSGISPGDTVVVSGVQNVRPGIGLQIDTSATAFQPGAVAPTAEGT